jgi:iron complex transport system ATP-binding protein
MKDLEFPESYGSGHTSVLACQEAWFGYKDKEELILKGVSLTLQEGVLLGIIGPNGSGKSTLLRVLSGALQPACGTVTLEGQALHRLGKRTIARKIAVLVQEEATDFAFTVREVVSMGRAPHHRGLYFEQSGDIIVIESSMERTGVAHLADRSMEALSGGERQRVRIARALAQQPRFLLLDEPTNHLDLHSQLSVLELLQDIHSEGQGILIVSHDINFVAELCESIRLIRDGVVMFEGTAADVITEENIALCFDIKALVDLNPVTGSPRVTPLGRLNKF